MSEPIHVFDLRHTRGVTRHLFGRGAIAAGVENLDPELSAREVFVVSARPILDLHAAALDPLRDVAGRLEILEVPDGEAAKSVGEAESLWRRLLALGGKRDSLLVAFGGGSVSDLTGFVGGAFLRGVDWIVLPTTLLAQIDAAVGGKTGVDLPESKNAVGLFHHPRAVWAELPLLATLPRDQLRSGLVEAVKVGAILDRPLFERLEEEIEPLLAGEPDRLAPAVAAAARVKATLVESDPDEHGPRRLLNFGHTLGHAIEAEVGYGRIAHGDAVAHGILFALELSLEQGGDPASVRRVRDLVARLGIPELPRLDVAGLLSRMSTDKKARRSGLTWILLEALGRGRFAEPIAAPELERRLEEFFDPSRDGLV